ncbi:MAG: GAF domain-containing sensor histidine kinase [Sphaerobacter sp.]|nr:GAF domain-containing sensor histidine kinase [Sphaerobacter sp.]
MASIDTDTEHGTTSAPSPAAPFPLTPAPPFARRLRLLKWITVVVPGVVVFALEITRHQLIEPFLYAHGGATRLPTIPLEVGNLVVGLIAFGLAFLFSHLVFGVIEHMQGRLLRRNAELAALNAVAATAGASLQVEEIVAHAQETLRRLFPRDQVRIELTPPGGATPAADDGAPTGGEAAVLRVPLRAPGHVHGTLSLLRPDTGFTPSERRLLGAIGDTLGMAIENARLHQQVHEAAVVEERSRIAREMHDGVAQVLAYVLVKLGTVDGLLAAGATEPARREIETLRQAAERAYTDVREQILGLRLVTNGAPGLAGWLRTYLDDFIDQTGLDACLDLDDLPPDALPRAHELQIIRIVQEALSNVRKHADARRVHVRGTVDQGSLLLSVADDGRGFQPDAPADRPGHHFGLLTMRERAEALGGALTIDSQPGQGTRVTLRVPLPTTGGHRRDADLVAAR